MAERFKNEEIVDLSELEKDKRSRANTFPEWSFNARLTLNFNVIDESKWRTLVRPYSELDIQSIDSMKLSNIQTANIQRVKTWNDIVLDDKRVKHSSIQCNKRLTIMKDQLNTEIEAKERSIIKEDQRNMEIEELATPTEGELNKEVEAKVSTILIKDPLDADIKAKEESTTLMEDQLDVKIEADERPTLRNDSTENEVKERPSTIEVQQKLKQFLLRMGAKRSITPTKESATLSEDELSKEVEAKTSTTLIKDPLDTDIKAKEESTTSVEAQLDVKIKADERPTLRNDSTESKVKERPVTIEVQQKLKQCLLHMGAKRSITPMKESATQTESELNKEVEAKASTTLIKDPLDIKIKAKEGATIRTTDFTHDNSEQIRNCHMQNFKQSLKNLLNMGAKRSITPTKELATPTEGELNKEVEAKASTTLIKDTPDIEIKTKDRVSIRSTDFTHDNSEQISNWHMRCMKQFMINLLDKEMEILDDYNGSTNSLTYNYNLKQTTDRHTQNSKQSLINLLDIEAKRSSTPMKESATSTEGELNKEIEAKTSTTLIKDLLDIEIKAKEGSTIWPTDFTRDSSEKISNWHMERLKQSMLNLLDKEMEILDDYNGSSNSLTYNNNLKQTTDRHTQNSKQSLINLLDIEAKRSSTPMKESASPTEGELNKEVEAKTSTTLIKDPLDIEIKAKKGLTIWPTDYTHDSSEQISNWHMERLKQSMLDQLDKEMKILNEYNKSTNPLTYNYNLKQTTDRHTQNSKQSLINLLDIEAKRSSTPMKESASPMEGELNKEVEAKTSTTLIKDPLDIEIKAKKGLTIWPTDYTHDSSEQISNWHMERLKQSMLDQLDKEMKILNEYNKSTNPLTYNYNLKQTTDKHTQNSKQSLINLQDMEVKRSSTPMKESATSTEGELNKEIEAKTSTTLIKDPLDIEIKAKKGLTIWPTDYTHDSSEQISNWHMERLKQSMLDQLDKEMKILNEYNKSTNPLTYNYNLKQTTDKHTQNSKQSLINLQDMEVKRSSTPMKKSATSTEGELNKEVEAKISTTLIKDPLNIEIKAKEGSTIRPTDFTHDSSEISKWHMRSFKQSVLNLLDKEIETLDDYNGSTNSLTYNYNLKQTTDRHAQNSKQSLINLLDMESEAKRLTTPMKDQLNKIETKGSTTPMEDQQNGTEIETEERLTMPVESQLNIKIVKEPTSQLTTSARVASISSFFRKNHSKHSIQFMPDEISESPTRNSGNKEPEQRQKPKNKDSEPLKYWKNKLVEDYIFYRKSVLYRLMLLKEYMCMFFKHFMSVLFSIALVVRFCSIMPPENGEDHKYSNDFVNAVVELRQQIYGQDEAIYELSKHLLLDTPSLKIIILVGSTGVGKSYTVEIIKKNFPRKYAIQEYLPPIRAVNSISKLKYLFTYSNLIIMENLRERDLRDVLNYLKIHQDTYKNRMMTVLAVFNFDQVDDHSLQNTNVRTALRKIESACYEEKVNAKIIPYVSLNEDALKKCTAYEAIRSNLWLSNYEISSIAQSLLKDGKGCKGVYDKVKIRSVVEKLYH